MRFVKNSVAACAVLLLASCRLVLSTDGGGIISSELGLHDCDQPSCVFDITGPVEETYTAEATLLISPGDENIFRPTVGDQLPASAILPDTLELIQTELEILGSPRIIKAVLLSRHCLITSNQ